MFFTQRSHGIRFRCFLIGQKFFVIQVNGFVIREKIFQKLLSDRINCSISCQGTPSYFIFRFFEALVQIQMLFVLFHYFKEIILNNSIQKRHFFIIKHFYWRKIIFKILIILFSKTLLAKSTSTWNRINTSDIINKCRYRIFDIVTLLLG